MPEQVLEFCHVFYPGHGGFTAAYRIEGEEIVAGFSAIAPESKRILRRLGSDIAKGRRVKRPVRIKLPADADPQAVIMRAFTRGVMPNTKTHARALKAYCPLWWPGFVDFLRSRKLDAK